MTRPSERQRHIRDTKTRCCLTNERENGKNGEPGGTRTRDHRIKSAMLYQLSYRPLRNTRLREPIPGDFLL